MNQKILAVAKVIDSWSDKLQTAKESDVANAITVVVNKLPMIVYDNESLEYIVDKLIRYISRAHNAGVVSDNFYVTKTKDLACIKNFLMIKHNPEDYALRSMARLVKMYKDYNFDLTDMFTVNFFKISPLQDLLEGVFLANTYMTIMKNNNMRVLLESTIAGMMFDHSIGNDIDINKMKDCLKVASILGWRDDYDSIEEYLHRCNEIYFHNHKGIVECPTIKDCSSFAARYGLK